MSDYWTGNITGAVNQVNAQISGSQRGDVMFSDVQDVKDELVRQANEYRRCCSC